MTPESLAGMIDSAMLKPETSAGDIRKLCLEAVEFGFKAVCVNSCRVRLAADILAGAASPLVCSTVGFPFGADAAAACEAALAVEAGAREIDMVMAVGLVKDGDLDWAARGISEVVRASRGHPVKVILETCLLTDEEKIACVEICAEQGAAFVKTSTGFSRAGATVPDVALLSRACRGRMAVKASGGIADLDTALALIDAGASRLGLTRGVQLVQEMRKRAASGVD